MSPVLPNPGFTRVTLLLVAFIALIAAVTLGAPIRSADAATPQPSPLTQVFSGTLVAKIGSTNQAITRPVTITVTSVAALGSIGGYNGNITVVKVASASNVAGQGDVLVDTTTSGWSRTPGSTSRFNLSTPSTAAAQVYINGAWRLLKKTAGKDTVIANFMDGGRSLRVLISGQAANGVGSGITSVEISNVTPGSGGSTTDAAPIVVSTNPANGAIQVGQSISPSFTYSEPVTALASALTLSCDGTPVPFTFLGSGTNTLTIDPTADLTQGAFCTATINSSLVRDADTIDGPDAGSGIESFSFTVDIAPFVVSFAPDTDGGLPANTNITITFSEPVTVSLQAIILQCDDVTIPFVLTMNSARTVTTINPTGNLPEDTDCELEVFGPGVSDVDLGDAPDGMDKSRFFYFHTDAAPFVEDVYAYDGEGSSDSSEDHHFVADLSTLAEFEIDFSESVSLDAGAITVSCAGIPATIFVSVAGEYAHILPPVGGWLPGRNCTGTIHATKAHDLDAVDPVDTMTEDETFTFNIDAEPYVLSISPANGQTWGFSQPIVVTFSEPVDATYAASVACGGEMGFPIGAGESFDGGTTWTWQAGILSVTGEVQGLEMQPMSCTFRLVAAGVNDLDFVDPPSNMAADFTATFNIDEAPYVVSTFPANGATNVPVDTTFSVTFSEPVSWLAGQKWVHFNCGGTDVADAPVPATTTGPQSTFSFPAAPVFGGKTCTFTIYRTGYADADISDPPEYMNFDYSFTVSFAPNVS